MKKLFVGILFGVAISFCLLGIESLFNSREKIAFKTAFITIKNESDYSITKATLKHGSGEMVITNINKGKTAYLGFPNGIENSYQLIVVLENDSILKTKSYYFEYGLRAVETIKNSEIISENNW
jgi:hypothetical protein